MRPLPAIAVVVLACLCSSSWASSSGWASVNGYYPSMPKAEAKRIGYMGCKESSWQRENIECELPADKRSIGGIQAIKGSLIFKPPHHSFVSEVNLSFDSPSESVIRAFDTKFGAHTSDTDYYYWSRSDGYTVRLSTGGGHYQKTHVLITYDAQTGAARQKEAKESAAKQRKLKSF